MIVSMLDMHKQYHADKGFTIIEVLIVLAIVGLILLIIFLVVPTLNRNSRNFHRKEAVNYVASQLSEYYANNGAYPYMGTPATDHRTQFTADKIKSSSPIAC